MNTFLIVILILILVGAFGSFPVWPHSAGFGYWPSSGLGLLFIILLILALAGKI